MVGAMWTAFMVYIRFLNQKFVTANDRVAGATAAVADAVTRLTERFDALVQTDHVRRADFEAERNRIITMRETIVRNTVRLEALEGRAVHSDARERDGG